MDETQLEQSLEVYKAQLAHVQQQLSTVGETEELKSLVSDLKELISLTEGSLVSLKKSQLLKTLEDAESSSPSPSSSSQPSTAPISKMDEEYALFQAMMQEEEEEEAEGQEGNNSHSTHQTSSGGDNLNITSIPQTFHNQSLEDRSPTTLDNCDSDSSSDSEGDNTVTRTVDEELTSLIGMKCCAPFSHDWGKMDFHNAMVMSALRDSQTDKILVTVMYTTPTHTSMQPCKYYLDGRCRFNEDNCKFSHGQTVALEELREFVEADHSTIAVDTKCLAQYTDNIWYRATITEVTDNIVSVHFDDYGEDLDVNITQVVPSVPQEDVNSDNEEETTPEASTSMDHDGSAVLDSEEEDEELPTFLWQPPQTTAALGEWEAHTRGIGSKLMSRMGYITGQGLGVNCQGKAEPVPIMLLPQGKSLDRIMELKEMAGNQDLFNAMKKMEKQKRKADKKREEQGKNASSVSASTGPSNVFDFINTKLAGKKGNLSSLAKLAGQPSSSGPAKGEKASGSESRRHISEHELHKKTDKDINLQVFKTMEEIRNVERQIKRLREQLARNENKDRRVAAQIRTKLEEQQSYLAKLQSSSSALEKHQKKRSNSKKLTIF